MGPDRTEPADWPLGLADWEGHAGHGTGRRATSPDQHAHEHAHRWPHRPTARRRRNKPREPPPTARACRITALHTARLHAHKPLPRACEVRSGNTAPCERAVNEEAHAAPAGQGAVVAFSMPTPMDGNRNRAAAGNSRRRTSEHRPRPPQADGPTHATTPHLRDLAYFLGLVIDRPMSSFMISFAPP